jgi:hypothetical protein
MRTFLILIAGVVPFTQALAAEQPETLKGVEITSHEDVRRVDSLAEDLSRKGVPVVRTHTINFNLAGRDSSLAERINLVMKGSPPVEGKPTRRFSLTDYQAEPSA